MERVMLEKLDQYMIQAWTAQSSDRMLEDCLRIYATVGRYAQAERVNMFHATSCIYLSVDFCSGCGAA